MTRINLLDWRAERREQQKREFFAMLIAGLLVGVFVVAAFFLTFDRLIDGQRDRNALLTQEIAEADRKIKEIEDLERVKSNLVSRMQVIEALQASRSAAVHFFDDLVNTLPEGVNLVSVKQEGAIVTIDGVAESNGRVSTYMKNLDASPWFDDPQLVVIRSEERGSTLRESRFTLKVKNLTKGTPADANAEELQ